MSYEIKRIVVTDLMTNCYLIHDSSGNAVVIDPGGDANHILAFLRRQNLKLCQILNTHGHADHIMGNAALREATGAPIAIHPLDAHLLNDPLRNAASLFGWPFQPHKPDHELREGEIVGPAPMSFDVVHTPGHTPGSCSFLDREYGVMFTGDWIFKNGIGRWDIPGGDYDTLMRSVRDKFLPLPGGMKIHPGHGDETTAGAERKRNPFIVPLI
ncbi:MAG: MBL fold metallo-hydrolase [bacterium]|nr:MBL fold metallo-hydrolase [Candidatus Sumerlaeota bacterium]